MIVTELLQWCKTISLDQHLFVRMNRMNIHRLWSTWRNKKPSWVVRTERQRNIKAKLTTQIVDGTLQPLFCFSSWCLTSRKGVPKPVPKKIMKFKVRRYLFWIWNGRFWKGKQFLASKLYFIFHGHFQSLRSQSHRARGFDSVAAAAGDRRRELARRGLHQGSRQHRHFGLGLGVLVLISILIEILQIQLNQGKEKWKKKCGLL